VAQDQILEDQAVAGATGINKDAKEQIEEAQHRGGRISAGFLSRQKWDAKQGALDLGSVILIDFCRPTPASPPRSAAH
jgi:hypothetical protein